MIFYKWKGTLVTTGREIEKEYNLPIYRTSALKGIYKEKFKEGVTHFRLNPKEIEEFKKLFPDTGVRKRTTGLNLYTLDGIEVLKSYIPEAGNKVIKIEEQETPESPKQLDVQDIKVKEYKGQRVVTFKDIDEVHGRVGGTASRNFRENKKRFTEEEHYFYLTGEELRLFKQATNIVGSHMKELILITEKGYLKLTKPFTDDRSWEIQDRLVDSYFREKEMLKLPKIPTTFAEALRLAADMEEEKQKLESEKLMLEQQVADYTPKVTYLDTILESTDSVVVSQIAEDYGLTAQELNRILHEEGIQYKINGQWLLYSQHKGKGYTESKTHKFVKANGEIGTNLHTRWTQKGRLFIHQMLDKRGIKPLMDREEQQELFLFKRDEMESSYRKIAERT